jgi:hypothetical protein
MSFLQKVNAKFKVVPSGEADAAEKALILYHGLVRKNLSKIKTQGLKPSYGYGGAGTKGVYLTKNKDTAVYWAKLQYMRNLEEYTMVDETLFDKRYGKQLKNLLAVVQVTIPPSDFNKLYADIEQREDVGFDGDESDWKASLEQIGDVRFDGTITPAWIKDVEI